MAVITDSINLQSNAQGEVHEITYVIEDKINNNPITNGIVTIFTPSSTSALTTIEYEPGCVADIQRHFDETIPEGRQYAHNARWGDGNGHSHLRAAILGPSLTIPFKGKRMTLGTWQQIIFIDFDNKPRRRELIVQIIGE